jgi:sugar lactone lactonase YvrE
MSLSTVTTTIEGDRVEVALPASYELGEGSLYAPGLAEGAGYLHVDILGRTVSVHRPDEPGAGPGGAVVTYRMPSSVGTVVPVAGGKQLLVALAKGPALLTLGSGALAPIASAQVEADVPDNRTNDGKVGPDGRFYFGTMHAASVDPRPPSGSLYVMDADGGVRKLLTGVTVSNGLGWTADGRTMYYIDTPTQTVQAFDFDAAGGTLSNGRVAFKIDPSLGKPDGMTMDTGDNLWVAMWGGSHVLGFRPDGTLFARVRLPTAHVSSVAFGGKGLTDMYITTAKVREMI